jgi:hypothetical protein
MAAYETSVTIGPFRGIMQESDGEGMSLSYAAEAENCDVSGGGLKPLRGGRQLFDTLPDAIGTLMRLYRRYYGEDDEKEVLVAAAGNRLYTKTAGSDKWAPVANITLQNDDMDWVTYEVNRDGDESPVDVLLMTNADDGMICLYGDDLHAALIHTPYKFGILARHAERIWGGAVPEHPDTLVYSAPFDPFNWAANEEIPEDGGGEILQPSWDGDSFVALKPFGSQLLAIKRNRVWRIVGTDPGSYYMKEQFGTGTASENSIAVNADLVYMLGPHGLLRYDGTITEDFYQSAIQRIWQRVNLAYLQNTCGAVYKNRLYMAVPIDGSYVNNAIIEYDLRGKAFMLRTGVSVRAFLVTSNGLYYTSAENPYAVFVLGEGDSLPLYWASGYQDLGAKDVVKSSYVAYLAVEAEQDIAAKVTLSTEKRVKTKEVTIPGSGKVKRIRLSGTGRRFRFELAVDSQTEWSLLGGILIRMETDED